MPSGNLQPNQAALILRNVLYGFAFVLLPAFFVFEGNDLWNLPRWVLAAAFLSIALPLAALGKTSPLQIPRPFVYFLLAWIGLTALSAIHWQNTGDIIYLMGTRMLGIGIFFWLNAREDVDGIIPFLSVLGVLEALIGLGEFAGLITMNELMDPPIGTVGNNNIYGCLQVLLLPFPLIWARKSSGTQRILLLLSAALIAGMASVSTSKTALLAIGLAGLILGGLYLLKEKTKMLENAKVRRSVLIGIPLVLIAIPILWAWMGFSTGNYASKPFTGITERGLIWRESIDMVQEEPLLGHGPAAWKYEMLEKGLTGYTTFYGLRIFTRPHNDFLWIAAESGLLAALAYIAMLTFLFVFAIQRAMRTENKLLRDRNYLLGAGVLIWIIVSNLNFPLERVDHMIVYGAYAGLILTANGPRSKHAVIGTRILLLLSSVVFVLLTLFGGQRFLQDRHLQDLFMAHQNMELETVLEKGPLAYEPPFTVDYYTSSPIPWYKGTALLNLGRPQEALPDLTLAYVINPYHPHVVNNLASAYALLGDFDQAEVYYREAIDRFGDFPDPYVTLSRIMMSRGDTTQAIELLHSYPDQPGLHQDVIIRELQLVGQ